MIKSGKTALFLILLTLECFYATAQQSVSFFGIESSDADVNMLSMTEDLFYKQLSDMNVSVKDRRNEKSSLEQKDQSDSFFEEIDSDYVFYAEIKKLPDSRWHCNINMRNQSKKATRTFSREYDSYYKILMESKSTLKNILSDLMEDKSVSESAKPAIKNTAQATTDSIAGSWAGEDSISKIVIMRGGRGFIVFKNGATMNISVQIQKQDDGNSHFVISQTSSPNASFFPDIDRRLAMEAAVSAEPIEWNLIMNADGILEGTKKTLVQQGDSVKPTTVPAKWTKPN